MIWKPVTGAATVGVGPDQTTDSDRSPFTVATGLAGAFGVLIAVTPAEAADCGPSTTVLRTPDTLRKYCVPPTRPVAVHGLPVGAEAHEPVVTSVYGPPTAVAT